MKAMETGRKTGFSSWLRLRWSTESHFGTVLVLLVLIIMQTVVLGFDFGSFGEWFSAWGRNWINILRNNAGVGIIALGMAFVIIAGGIDLSVGSTLVAIGAASMMMLDIGPKGFLGNLGITGLPAFALTIVLAVLMGLVLGVLTGLLITKGRIAPFVATLGSMKILRSVTQHFMQGYNPRIPREFLQLANLQVGGLMFMPIIYWLAIALILIYVSQRTVWGRQVIAVGSNERAAQLSGVNVNRVKIGTYSLMGVLVGIASIIQVARIGTMDFANAGSGYEMDAIAAVVVGGTSMRGGRGTIFGTVLGMLIIAVMNNLLNLFGVPPFLREAAKGVIVIGSVLLQRKGNV
ncbi:MAG TPA: ABC transporter permease [Firmicutes bacterium]|jgi:ribose transport system permease protein|nr:ABC transporter permease [Bacillota bacterium]